MGLFDFGMSDTERAVRDATEANKESAEKNSKDALGQTVGSVLDVARDIFTTAGKSDEYKKTYKAFRK
ncbi:MAG: hypothetical protein WC081_03580 [Candidatus Ratteibacteria bacterium]|jgi:hypothetical protein